MSRRLGLGTPLILALLLAPGACRRDAAAPPAPAVRPDIVLITIDTLRDDRVNDRLTPALARLASRGTRFTRTWSVAPLTLPAHASLMTASYPPRHGVRLNGVHRFDGAIPTLAAVLRAGGYDTAAFVGAFVLDRRFGLAEGFDVYDDEVPRSAGASARLEAERRGDAVVDRALAWYDAPARAATRPRFLWIHLYDPHAPYAPPSAFLARAEGHAYDGEVAFADAQVQRVIDATTRAGRADRTLVAVAGDHGESLGEHGESTHGMLLYEAPVRVPLVIAGPGVSAGAASVPASLVDVAPTLLARAGISAPAVWQGRDLLRREHDAREVYFETKYPEVMGWSPAAGVADGEWKLIDGGRRELYALERDAGEALDVAGSRAPVTTALAARLASWQSSETQPARAPVSADAQERLRALGYVGAAPASSSRRTGERPDAASRISQWVRLEQSLTLLQDGRASEAVTLLRAVAREAPDSPLVQTSLGRALHQAGRSREALAALRAAVARWPADARALHDLAVAAGAAGDAGEARRAEEAAIALDPRDPVAHHGLGLILADSGDTAGARAAFARAVQLDPAHAPFLVDLANAERQAGDDAAAERGYRQALALDPRSADALNGLAVLHVRADRPAEALPLLRQALAIEPAFVEAWLNLGIAAQQAGDLATARDAYAAVLAAAPRDARERRAARELLANLPPR